MSRPTTGMSRPKSGETTQHVRDSCEADQGMLRPKTGETIQQVQDRIGDSCKGSNGAFLMRRLLLPKETLARPYTTYHEIGWYPSTELFGVSQRPIRRDPALWPERGVLDIK